MIRTLEAPSRRQECPRDEDGNFIDAITADIIPPDRLIIISAGQTVHCYDIDTLYRWHRDHPDSGDPMTRQPFDETVLNEILQYGETLKRLIIVDLHGEGFQFIMDVDTSLGETILQIFQLHQPFFEGFDSLFNYNFLVDSLTRSRRSVYNYNLLTPLRDTDIVGAKEFPSPGIRFMAVVLTGDPAGIRERMYRRWYQFAENREIEGLIGLIPERFRQLPIEEVEEPSAAKFREMAQIIFEHTASGRSLVRILGTYVQMNQPKISAEQSETLVGLLPSQIGLYYERILEHLIYSRVVDKGNLRPTGISQPYYARRNQSPNYQIESAAVQNEIRSLTQPTR